MWGAGKRSRREGEIKLREEEEEREGCKENVERIGDYNRAYEKGKIRRERKRVC